MNIRLIPLALVALVWFAPVHAELASTIEKVKPSVVIVGTYRLTQSPRFRLWGTGFVVGDGSAGNSNLVVTNAHVIQQATQESAEPELVIQIRVGQNELQMRRVTVIEFDKAHDLVLLRFDGPMVPSLRVGSVTAVREGQSIAFMGFPIGGALGFSPVTHRGMVSSIAAVAMPTATAQQLNEKTIRSLRTGALFDVLQLDATAYPGNSGGPLFDPDTGDVLGVVNMVFVKGTRESALSHPSGISFAIPAVYVQHLLQQNKMP